MHSSSEPIPTNGTKFNPRTHVYTDPSLLC